MGDIVICRKVWPLAVDIRTSTNREVDIFNGLERWETIRPFKTEELGSRDLRSGKARNMGLLAGVIWDGSAFLSDNKVISAKAINFFNKDKTLNQPSATELNWRALTTGNIGGIEMTLPTLQRYP